MLPPLPRSSSQSTIPEPKTMSTMHAHRSMENGMKNVCADTRLRFKYAYVGKQSKSW